MRQAERSESNKDFELYQYGGSEKRILDVIHNRSEQINCYTEHSHLGKL